LRRPCRIVYTGPEPPPRPREGAAAAWLPLVSVEPVEGASLELLAAAPREGETLLVFTSPRAPRLLALDALRHGVYGEVRGLAEASDFAAVGPATMGEAEALLGAPRSRVLPEYWSVESLARALRGLPRRYATAVVLRASNPSPSYGALLEALAGLARRRVEVTVYRNTVLEGNAALLAGADRAGLVDVVAVSSPLQARALAAALRGPPRARLAAIGRATRRALEGLGFTVAAEPRRPGVAALLEAAAGLCG